MSQGSANPADSQQQKLVKAMQLYNNKKYQKAKEICQKLLQKNPKNGHACHLMGAIAYTQQNLDQAETLFKRAIQAEAKESKFHENLGLVYFVKKDYPQAISAFQNSV